MLEKRIKELRISSNLTQDKIAEYLSLNQSMIAKMEKVKGISRMDLSNKASNLRKKSWELMVNRR